MRFYHWILASFLKKYVFETAPGSKEDFFILSRYYRHGNIHVRPAGNNFP